MEKVIILLVIGYAIGFYIRDRRAKEALVQSERQAAGQIETLRRQIATLNKQAADRQQEDERRRQYRQENDLSDPQNQLRFIGECSLKAVPPVNREAVRVLYAIDEWISFPWWKPSARWVVWCWTRLRVPVRRWWRRSILGAIGWGWNWTRTTPPRRPGAWPGTRRRE